ncbi:MAG TPA: alpha/beta fold hydrolase [Vicinamibacterales bacterium]|nr:alpha/beta fold hydrolase [Vicinamibacterales bacterium]
MTPQRWGELKDFLAFALTLPDSERSQFISEMRAKDEELGDLLATYLRDSHVRQLGSDLQRLRDPDVRDDPFQPPPVPKRVGPYEIVSSLGRGGMAEVYRAHDARLNREVAIKRITSPFLRSDQILHEGRALARLNHGHIATVYDVLSDNGCVYLVMECLRGETLAQRLVRGSLGLKEIANLGSQIAEALVYAHEQNVLHCDLKPANVFVTESGVAKVLDFGLARYLTEQTDVLGGGTPPYMAPEQYSGGPIDARTDVYALGVILMQMTYGELPGQSTRTAPPSDDAVGNSTLRGIIAKATAFDPAQRWASASELLGELQRVREHKEPTSSLPISFVTTRDGVRLAFASTGTGPVLIHVRGWVTHLLHLWADEQYRRFVESLARHYRVIRYDGRGNGLADRVDVKSLAELVDDLDAIANTVANQKVILLATCFGGPIAMEWVRRRPDRVAALVLDGTFVKGEKLASRTRRMLLRRAFATVPELAFLVLSYLTSSTAVGRSYRSPHIVRESIEPRTAAALYELAFSIDVERTARQIAVPTLVLHRTESTAIPVKMGREVAHAIPHSTFVELPGSGHNPWDQDSDEYVKLIRDFVCKL